MHSSGISLQFGVDDWLRMHPVLLGLLGSAGAFVVGCYGPSKGRSMGALVFRGMALLILLSFAADTIHSRMFLATAALLFAFGLELWLMKRRYRAN